MRRPALALLIALCLALPAAAQDGRDAAIRGVISRQMEAFLADDVATAFSFAAPGIKGIFGTPENFGRMVQQGYPMVWRPGDVTFGPLRQVAGGLWQRVIVEDAEGRLHALDYQMVETPEGWQIAGVQLLQAPDIGA